MIHFIRSIVCVLLLANSATGQDLTAKAEAILKQSCADCHAGGAAEGRMNYVLNAGRLISKGKVIPKDPTRSKLIKEVESGRMPKDGDKLSKADIQTLKDWVAAGAPAFKATEEVAFISPEAILLAIVKDLSRKDIDPDDRPFFRYFTLTHLYNAGLSSDELLTYKQALFKLINSLSWEGEMHVPHPIDIHETIFRIDLRKLQWNEATWDSILKANPYGVTHTSTAARDCYAYTACRLPYVRGDWFVFAAARPPLYHLILELPDSDLALEQRLNVRVAENIRTRQVFRNGFNESGVSAHNRMIEWHRLPNGAYIKSYDFKGSEGKRSLFEHPTGPGGVNGFEHDGGEIIFNLPNGLQAYLLVDAKGRRIDVGPTDVVLDKEAVRRGLQAEVINGISCMGCHKNGMIRKEDEIRAHVTANVNAFDTLEAKLILALYPRNDDWEKLFEKGEKRFRAAVHQSLGDPESAWNQDLPPTEQITALAALFQDALDLDLAAAESGLQPQALLDGLAREAELARKLGSLRTPGGSVKRDVFVAAFPLLAKKLDLGTFVIPDTNFRPILPGQANPQTTEVLGAGKNTGEVREITLPGGVKLKQIWCPPGTFMMGTPGATDDEAAVDVTLSSGFWLAQTETTQAQYTAIMGTTPWVEHGDTDYYKAGANFPASYIDHPEAAAFCAKLTEIERKAGRLPTGWKYALPTEAQWEYACRAGTTTAYSFGDDDTNLGDFAWFDKNAYDIGEKFGHMAATKKPNPWGLHDMHGNVYEWCRDAYGGKLPGGKEAFVDSSDAAADRVYRGGSWYSASVRCRSARRSRRLPANRNYGLGFRPATVPDE